MRGRLWQGVLIIGLVLSACARELDSFQPVNDYGATLQNTTAVFRNGGFEDWEGVTIPVHWTAAAFSDFYDTFDLTVNPFDSILRSTNVYEGLYSIELTWQKQEYDSPVLYQGFAAQPGTNYIATLWVVSATGAPKISIALKWFKADMTSAGYQATTSASVGTNWTRFILTNQCPWNASFGYFMILGNTSASYSGTIAADGAGLQSFGGGVMPTVENFKGPYAAVTNVNYDSNFHGTTPIADLYDMVPTAGSTSNGSWPIKGVITGLTVYSGAVSKRSFFVQDSSRGIYTYLSADATGIDDNAIGKVFSATVTRVQNYNGTVEITIATGISITTNEAPAAIYVTDITNSDPDMEGNVVRYTDVVANKSGGTYYFTVCPELYGWSSVGYVEGDTVTCLGPLTSYSGTLEISEYKAWPQTPGLYSFKHWE